MSKVISSRAGELRRIILEFLDERLQEKLKGIKASKGESEEVERLTASYELSTWIADAARKAAQLQVVSHTVKAINSNAKGTSILYSRAFNGSKALVTTSSAGANLVTDVVGNAAALAVYKFLMLRYGQSTLLDLMRARDEDLRTVLNPDPERAEQYMLDFSAIIETAPAPASHTLAKQIYFLSGSDPQNDKDYHLLAPLFPSSLVHRVYLQITEDRFSEESKIARQARRAGKYSPTVIHDYPKLVVQKLGGTKPQNVSQLNSERRGENYLLPSLPPRWKTESIRPIYRVESLFRVFEGYRHVKETIHRLLEFLKSDPGVNIATRAKRDDFVDSLVNELIHFTMLHRALPQGWTNSKECRLPTAERFWLEPGTMQANPNISEYWDKERVTGEISQSFGRWLNRKLRDPLPMGDAEFSHWCGLAERGLTSAQVGVSDV